MVEGRLSKNKRKTVIDQLIEESQPGANLQSVKGSTPHYEFTIGIGEKDDLFVYITELFGRTEDARYFIPQVSTRRQYIGTEKGLVDFKLEEITPWAPKSERKFFIRPLADYTNPVQEGLKKEFDDALLNVKKYFQNEKQPQS